MVRLTHMTYTKKGKYYTTVLVSAGNTLLKEKKDSRLPARVITPHRIRS